MLEYIACCLYSHPSSRARACKTFCFHSWGGLLLKNKWIFLKTNIWIEEGKVKEIRFAVGIGWQWTLWCLWKISFCCLQSALCKLSPEQTTLPP